MDSILPLRSKKYQVVSPEKIKVKEEVISEIPENYVLVKPLLTGICQSDLRYFFGRRDPEVLKKRYPLCLLHEGIAEVVESSDKFKKGDKVVVIPNIPCYIHNESGEKCSSCKEGNTENYCENPKFMSSSCDGMSQTYFLQPAKCLAIIPEEVPDKIAVLTELLTVTYRAIIEADINENDKVIVFGCGPTGYLMAALLRFVKKIKKEKLFVVDIDDKKLTHVKLFATAVNIKNESISENFDKAFECVGGKGSEAASNQAIQLLKPKGVLIFLGVSEEKRAIDTRTILDKGLIIKGTSRSPRQDYSVVLDFLKDKELQNALLKIIHDEKFKADSISELVKAFKKADDPEHYGKVLIEWN